MESNSGVSDDWIIDGDAQAYEIWHSDDERPALVDDRLVWQPSNASEAFVLDVQGFFASVEDAAPLF